MALQYKIFINVFQYILKSIKTFLIENYFYINAKNANKTKKLGQNLIWQQIPKLKILNYCNEI